jgi:hypothetical protein
VIHLRIVAPEQIAHQALELLCAAPAVINVIHLQGASRKPAAPGLPSDAVVWEEVESRTSEDTELSFSFVLFMIAAMQIAAVGIVLDQPILIVGAMVVRRPSRARSWACSCR